MLLEVYPEGAQAKDPLGNLPLHTAMLTQVFPNDPYLFGPTATFHGNKVEAANTPVEYPVVLPALVEALLAAYPQAAMIVNHDGMLPLHCLLERSNYGHDKSTSDHPNRYNRCMPEAFARNEPWVETFAANLHILLAANPGAASQRFRRGDVQLGRERLQELLPLHHAAIDHTDATVRALLEAYPDAVKVPTKDGYLPLHLAVMYMHMCTRLNGEASHVRQIIDSLVRPDVTQVVHSLVTAFPQAATTKAPCPTKKEVDAAFPHPTKFPPDAMTPLHQLLQRVPEGGCEPGSLMDATVQQVLDVLLKVCPEAAKEGDGRGALPLHYAQSRKLPLPLHESLLAAYPEAKKIMDPRLSPAGHSSVAYAMSRVAYHVPWESPVAYAR